MSSPLVRDILVLALPLAALGVAGCAVAVIVLERRTRKALSARTRRAERQARALFGAIPHGLLLLQGDEIAGANPWLCALVGRDRASLVGAVPPFRFVAPEHRHEFDAWLDQLRDKGEAEQEVVLRTTDGRRVVAEVAGRRIEVATSTPRYVVTVRDVTEKRRERDMLADLVVHDPATGLFNRRGFHFQLVEEVRRANENGKPLSLALLALEQLDADDERELLASARSLCGSVRAGEHVARTRAHELAWILPATDGAGATDAVERIRRAIFGRQWSPLLTVGVCDLEQAGDPATLYALADRALSAARATGPGRTALFSTDDPLPSRNPLIADELFPADA